MGSLIQGIVQGLTEFLPISSSGHLVFLGDLFGLRSDLAFVAFLHLGTFLAVFIFSFKNLIRVLKRPRLLIPLSISTLPAVVVGLWFGDAVESSFRISVLPITFSITAAFLGLSRGRSGSKKMEDMSIFDALMIGLAQALAVFPGISRSGLTIATAMLLGYDWKESMYYSFLLSLPVILGAGLLESGKMNFHALPGFISAFVFGMVGLYMVKFLIEKRTFHLFGYYLVMIAILTYFLGGSA